MTEINPPTDADRERASTDWVKEAQALFVAGFRSRQSDEPPEREQPGTKRKVRDWNESLAHMAEQRVPSDLPGHKRERWTAGYLHADGIAVSKGHRHLATRNPLAPPRVKKTRAAEPLEMFPEAITERRMPLRVNDAGLLAPWDGEKKPHFTTADEQ